MNKIMLVEDDPDIRDLVIYNLQKNGFSVTSADNANDALIMLDDIKVDIILLDLMLPGLKGMQFLDIVRNREGIKNIPVIIISAKNAEHDIITALEHGADDYLPKPFSMEILAAKINTVLRRGVKAEEGAPLEYMGIKMDGSRRKVFSDGGEIRLTHKEYELLKIFISSPNKIFTRNQLLNTVWGYDSESMTRTVDSHVSTLRKKLGPKGDIIKSIPKIGYGVEE